MKYLILPPLLAENSRRGLLLPPTCAFVLPGRPRCQATPKMAAPARGTPGVAVPGPARSSRGLRVPDSISQEAPRTGALRHRAEGGDLPARRRAQVGRDAEDAGICSSERAALSGNLSVTGQSGNYNSQGAAGRSGQGAAGGRGVRKGTCRRCCPEVPSSGRVAAAWLVRSTRRRTSGAGRREGRRAASPRAWPHCWGGGGAGGQVRRARGGSGPGRRCGARSGLCPAVPWGVPGCRRGLGPAPSGGQRRHQRVYRGGDSGSPRAGLAWGVNRGQSPQSPLVQLFKAPGSCDGEAVCSPYASGNESSLSLNTTLDIFILFCFPNKHTQFATGFGNLRLIRVMGVCWVFLGFDLVFFFCVSLMQIYRYRI